MDQSIKPIIVAFPVWEENTWKALQKKNYIDAGNALLDFMADFNNEEWQSVFWPCLIKGIPAMRGILSENEWRENFMPIIAMVVLNIADGERLSYIYRSLDLQTAIDFHLSLFYSVPKPSAEERLELIRTFTPSLAIFLTATPAQELGLEVFSSPKSLKLLSQDIVRHQYESLPGALKNAIFSFVTAESVFRIGAANHLTNEKISLLARVAGRVLLRIIHLDDLTKEIQKTLLITDNRSNITLAEELKSKVFSNISLALREGIMSASDVIAKEGFALPEQNISPVPIIDLPIADSKEQLPRTKKDSKQESQNIKLRPQVESDLKMPAAEEKVTPIAISQLPTNKSQVWQEKVLPKPFILHQEKSITETQIKKTSPGFSLPFGFFRKDKNNASTDTTISSRPVSIKAEIETASSQSKKENTTQPKAGIFGRIIKKESERIVHYGGATTQVTPFKKEEDVLFGKQVQETTNKQLLKTNTAKSEVKQRDIKSVPLAVSVKEQGQKKNPFGFPTQTQEQKTDKPKPRLAGNTVHLK